MTKIFFQFDLDIPWNYLRRCFEKGTSDHAVPLWKVKG